MAEQSTAEQSTASLVDLTGKVALVTGAGSGIGRACALRFADAGASLVCADMNHDAAEATARHAHEMGRRATVVKVDVRKESECVAAADTAIEAFGRLDAVVNCAGIFPHTPLMDLTVDQWDNMLDINTRGTFLVSRACARKMGQGSTIVNLASKAALQPTFGMGHYAASKGAVVMLTKSMALEFKDLRIRVNAIAPGSVKTEGTDRAAQEFADHAGVTWDDIKKSYTDRNPIGRECLPDEIARVALFLSTPLSSYVNGETILVDGGHLLT